MTKHTKVAPATPVEQNDKINALQTQAHAALVALMHSAESGHLTTEITVNTLWLAVDLMEELATALEAVRTTDKVDTLQAQTHALLVTLMHGAEHLDARTAVNALWLATNRMEKLAAAIAELQAGVKA